MTSNEGEKPPAAADEGVPSATTEQSAHPEQAKDDETGCDCKPRVVIHPKLLRAALHADCHQLRNLLEGVDEPRPAAAATSNKDDVVLDVDRSSPSPSSSPSTTAGAGTTTSHLEGTTFQGDSALHVVATSGDDKNFVDCATLIYNKAKHLLETTNNNGDTPLHCASRSGNVEMVSHLLKLAAGDADGAGDQREVVKEILRKENCRQETVLHEAVRLPNKDLIDKLMQEDPELARYPSDGTSPLYLAVILSKDLDVAKQLRGYDEKLSYSGPNGQNVLHAAVLRTKEATKLLLDWNKDLAVKGDKYGRTPLHFAVSEDSGSSIPCYYMLLFYFLKYIGISYLCTSRLLSSTKIDRNTMIHMLMDADESLAYQPDDKGTFPIHVAASEGTLNTLKILLTRSPDCASLRNAQGRTFLHVAVQEKRNDIILFVHWRKTLAARIMNMNDNDGNTALHIAVKAGNLHALLYLLMNPKVEIDCFNNEGLTARDISRKRLPKGLRHITNPQMWIVRTLRRANAMFGNPQLDHHEEKCIFKKYREKGDSGYKKDSEKGRKQEDSKTITETTQVMGFCSTLIAAVAFAAAFTLPGGYRSDDHNDGGTPTFVGRYAFDAFVLAITFAFIFSLLGTLSLVYSGMSKVDYTIRLKHLNLANRLVWQSIRCLLAAFALGLYVVLAPVANMTTLVVCLMCFIGLLYGHEELSRLILPAVVLHARLGFQVWSVFGWEILRYLLRPFWPFLIIFGWPAILKWRHLQ